MINSLKSLIAEELIAFKRLNENILSSSQSVSSTDAIALNYERILNDCFEFPVDELAQLAMKYDFMLTVIDRDYENKKQIESIRTALLSDIKRLEAKA